MATGSHLAAHSLAVLFESMKVSRLFRFGEVKWEETQHKKVQTGSFHKEQKKWTNCRIVSFSHQYGVKRSCPLSERLDRVPV